MNPYRWLFELAAVAALVLGIIVGVLYYGHGQYQKGAAYQLGIDEHAIDAQKAEAVRMIQDRDATIIALQQAQQAQRATQEKQHAEDQARTDAVARSLAPRVLRINVPVPGGCGQGRGVDVPGPSTSPVSSRTEIVQLPDALTGDLRQFARDADVGNDWYRVCYRSVHPDWKEPVIQ